MVFIAYFAAVGIHRASFAPNEGVDTFEELKSQGIPMTGARRVSNPAGHICVFGDVNSVMWTLPSGPPAYLFDRSGKLVDFTLDVGDSTKFQSEYLVYSGAVISLAEAETQFKAAP